LLKNGQVKHGQKQKVPTFFTDLKKTAISLAIDYENELLDSSRKNGSNRFPSGNQITLNGPMIIVYDHIEL